VKSPTIVAASTRFLLVLIEQTHDMSSALTASLLALERAYDIGLITGYRLSQASRARS